MKHTIILAAVAAAFVAAPAQAQPVAADLLPAYEVATIVTSMGLQPVGRPAWRRGRYIVAAIDRYGREVNVVLDAHNGQVLAVRPLARESFGAPPPPPGYGRGPAPYPMDGAASPYEAGPGGPPPDDGEFFDNERQQGSLPPPRTAARPAPAPRDPAMTGNLTRAAPVARRDATTPDANPKSATPVPRPRPALARANDPGNKPVPAPAGTPAVSAKPDDKKPEAAKPEAAETDKKPAVNLQTAKPDAKPGPANKPDQAGKPDQSSKADAKKETDVRVIDLGKPKAAAKPEDKPGDAIRF